MDGLPEMVAPSRPVTIGGKVYHLSPLRIEDRAEAGAYLRAQRKPSLEAVRPHLEGLDDKERLKLLYWAYLDSRSGEFVSVSEIERWFLTPEGVVYRLWLMIRRKHPEVTYKDVSQWIDDYKLAEVPTSDLDGLPEGEKAAVSEPPDPNKPRDMLPWRTIFRKLSEAYGWAPEQIGRMTLAQAWAYFTGAKDIGQREFVAPGEAIRARDELKKSFAEWCERNGV